MKGSGGLRPGEGWSEDGAVVLDKASAPGRVSLTQRLPARVQRATAPGASPTAASRSENGASAVAVPDAKIVDAQAELMPGQISRDQFLSQLREQVVATASEALGPVWSAVGCPYIESWFARNAVTPAMELERLARRYSGIARPTTATDYFGPIVGRLRDGIARWKAGEDVGADVAAAGLGAGAAPTSEAQPADRGVAVQRKAAGTGSAEPESPAAVLAGLGPGTALDGDHANRLGAAMDDSFGDVRLHTDGVAAAKASELGARAFTVGNHVAFATGEYRPGTPEGDALLAHELAHVQQQRGAAQGPELNKRGEDTSSGDVHEADADSVAAAALARLYGTGASPTQGARSRGGLAVNRARAAVSSGLALQRCSNNSKDKDKDASVSDAATQDTPLVAEIKQAIASGHAAAVLHKLRETTVAGPDERQAITAAIDGATTLTDDDKWLAEQLLTGNTADPNAGPTWVQGKLTDPDPDPGTTSPIQTGVYFVAGRTSRRAMVIGGVHGSEPEGAAVVQQLVEALKNARRKPLFTVILVPNLIDRSRQDPKSKSGVDAYRDVRDPTAKGSAGDASKGTGSEGNIEVEPNRNFPLPGKSYDSYKKAGHLEFWDRVNNKIRPPQDKVTRTDKKENRAKAVASEKMLPENRILVHLIERFQPERLASVHQHSVPGRRGDGPGVFVDPRRPASKLSADDGFDRNTDQALTPDGQQDDKLAEKMRDAIQSGAEAEQLRKEGRDPLSGNDVPRPGERGKRAKPPTTHYRTGAHAEGNSLGDWAPVEVKKGGDGDRPAIGTFTVELPQYVQSNKAQTDELAKLKGIEVDMLLNIFLEDPGSATP